MLPKCKNDTTVLLTDIKDVPGIFFYNTKIHDKLFCGDIRELQNIDKKNPWTNEDFTDELRDEISKYELIIENLDETEIEDMKTNLDEKMDTTIRKSMLKVLTKLRYPKDVDYYVNSNELQMNNFLSSLKAEHVISENDFNNINTSDLNGKKLALANLLQMKIEYDTSIIVINGSNISSLLVVLEEEYNKSF